MRRVGVGVSVMLGTHVAAVRPATAVQLFSPQSRGDAERRNTEGGPSLVLGLLMFWAY